jgi:anti-anti-sigma factor
LLPAAKLQEHLLRARRICDRLHVRITVITSPAGEALSSRHGHLPRAAVPQALSATAPLRSDRGGPACWATHSLTSSVIIIRAHGDIDASNASELSDYTRHQPTTIQGLIVDLRGVNFFAIEGFSVLLTVSVAYARTGMVWALVPGAAASRVLRICDPQHELPVGTVETALALFGQHPPPPHGADDEDPPPSAG